MQTEREKHFILQVLDQRRRIIRHLQEAQDRRDYATETKCREIVFNIEHNPDILSALQDYGLTWDSEG